MMEEMTIGVVADTHIPDRARGLHPALLPALAKAGVAQILHAGDICVPSVLDELRQVAPVSAVRGNRDWLLRGSLPALRRLEFAGVPLLLLHGQGSLPEYLLDKYRMWVQGYRLVRYQTYMRRHILSARVIVFGHSHQPENFWQDGRLWFNPGSAAVALRSGDPPTFGLLRFGIDGAVKGEIVPLSAAKENTG